MNIHQHPTNNSVLAAPPGASIDQCRALPVTRLQYPDGLAALGFPVVATDKTSKLYRLADMPAMLAAMVRHLEAVQAKAAA